MTDGKFQTAYLLTEKQVKRMFFTPWWGYVLIVACPLIGSVSATFFMLWIEGHLP